jgi:hypothetical protein
VRQEVLQTYVESEFVMFLDDDNLILPSYLATMVEALQSSPEKVGFAICEITHHGPLPRILGKPPVRLKGQPIPGFIDTLQVLTRTAAIKRVRWRSLGYLSDGFTYWLLGRKYQYVRVDECLGVHY